jgi:MFS family permease
LQREPAKDVDGDQNWWRDRRLLLLIGGYGLLAFTLNVLDESVPIFAATPRSHKGLSMDTAELGVPLSISGVALMLTAVFVYPRAQDRFGLRWCCQGGLVGIATTALLYPFAADISSTTASYIYFMAVCCLRSTVSTFAFTSAIVMLNVAAPKSHIGAINGMGQTLASFVRGIGPAIGGGLWSLSLGIHVPGSHFLVFATASAIAMLDHRLYGSVGFD